MKFSEFLICFPLMSKLGASGDDVLSCLCCVYYKACTEVSFRHDIKTTLKSVSSKVGKGCIIGVLKGKNHCRRSLSFGLETSQVEETTIKMILNSNAIR